MSTSTSLHSLAESAAGPASQSTSPTNEPEVLARERTAIRDLIRLVEERASAESEASQSRARNDAKADAEYSRTRQGLLEKFAGTEREERAADEARRRGIVDAAIQGEARAKADFAAASRRIAQVFDNVRETAKHDYNRARNEASAALEAGHRRAASENTVAMKPLLESGEIANGYRARLDALAAGYGKFKLVAKAPAPSRETYTRFDDPNGEILDRLSRMEPTLKILEGLIIPKILKGGNEVWVFLATTALAVGLAVWLNLGIPGMAGGAITGLAIGGLLRTWLVQVSKAQLEKLYTPLRQSLADVDGLNAHCRAVVDSRHAEERKRLVTRNEEDVQRAKDNRGRTIATGESVRDEQLREINEVYARRITEVQTNQAREMREAVETYDRRRSELRAHHERNLARLEEHYKSLKEQIKARYADRWDALAGRWRDGMDRVSAEFASVQEAVDAFGPSWDHPDWAGRSLPRAIPPVIRLGRFPVDLSQLPGGVSSDERLRDGLPTRYKLPALRPFPAANLVIEAPPEGRAAAIAVLQAVMFRILTSLPPGMVRFTIVDPIGIGRNFGAFMHLADFDPALVNNQVWTDPRQIEERLADLEAHMETVTQKYLRNEYETIEAYNAVAGEVAEPYRVLVVADFPTKFDEKAAGRLAAIASGGVPCGVITLIAADPTRPMPAGCRLQDLNTWCGRLAWNDGRLVWDDPDLARFPLELDPPPPSDFATREIQRVGAAARDARRVEVPFEFIAPAEDLWWTFDSRSGIDIPLGKAGATKRQNLSLGQGTSQHVLIAGRTGSGKSTLMHALITNLALSYSPDEIDLYLIDFKKGVEFKVYATHELPHASVVAIESEREFGISVLQRLDDEMRRRADRFRDAGVQDLSGYRNTPGTPPLPRILLIVDEFQEFFVEEDKIAQEAALLLDRLVRQGRAFGVHVNLGSQSLGGAFTLARSTLGQMAVRIALQCSEVDSLLILAENNLAAKWLSRPGEAIYNDANGAPEGNHFFQVVWLSDEKREAYLERLRDMGRHRKPALARTPIVFEGDAPADLGRNPLLRSLIESPAWPESPRSTQAWLGDAVAIKDPTSALFRRQGGNNLLIVGQNDEAALGVLAATLLGLVAQYPPAGSGTVRSGARFFVLDGTPEDHPQAGTLARIAGLLPHALKVGGWREVPAVLSELAAEARRRRQPEAPDGPELFLFIHDLPRLRDLRRREDDFSFSRREDEDAAPPDQLDLLLREGPPLGIHVIAWCDTVNNLNRHFTHQQLREFEMRVLFQMSPTDSGSLLDSPAASKLGRNRALFASEEQNRLEKFRPYGLPPADLLESVGSTLRGRPFDATASD